MGRKKKIKTIKIGVGKNKKILPIVFETVELSEEENQVRIETLARQVIRAVEEFQKKKL